MKRIIAIAALALLLISCRSGADQSALSDALDRLNFEEGETGCVDLRGDVDLGGNPFFGTTAALIVKKSKAGPEGEPAPTC